MRVRLLLALPMALLAAACSSSNNATPTATVTVTQSPTTAAPSTTPTATPTTPAVTTPPATSSPTAPSGCRTAVLRVHLGTGSGAMGSQYEPIIFTNKGTTTCTLNGYPYVAFVAPNTGKQVGAVASFNAAVPVKTITLAPGASASSLLQIVNYLNFGTSGCKATTVSGLRVYPPNNTGAAYVAFATNSKACSTQVGQLSVGAVVKGTTGQ